jgi:hypothetical protein
MDCGRFSAVPHGDSCNRGSAETVKKPSPILKLGDLVEIRHFNKRRGKIVELRGPLGPGGLQVYRVIVRRKPSPMYIELTEDQVVLLPREA